MSGSRWVPLQNGEKSCHGAFTQGCDCGAGGAEGATECPVGACSDLVRLAEAQWAVVASEFFQREQHMLTQDGKGSQNWDTAGVLGQNHYEHQKKFKFA